MPEGQRRLTTIVAADIAGFSRLVEIDEEATLATQRKHRAELIEPLLAEYNGRIANTAGDSFLFEFSSTVEAVRCAMAVQDGMAKRNADIPVDRRIEYRIGINLGDVVSDGDDLLGDGVNVAARIEALAEPGGICLSRAARDQVRDRMDINLKDLGEVEVKNITRPVRVFRVLGKGEAAAKTKSSKARWLKYAATTLFIVAVFAGGGAWWWQQQPDFEPADQSKMAFTVPDQPSIAVLPFKYSSGDKQENGYLADGLGENIASALGTLPKLLVVDWTAVSSAKFKDQDFQSVAENAGVRYVLSGSVQKSNDKLRVSVRLADAKNGRHLWSETFDRDVSGLFKLQDDIAKEIVMAMDVQFDTGDQGAMIASTTDNLRAYKYYMRARGQFRKYTPASSAKAVELYQKAEREDPNFTANFVGRATMHAVRARFYFVKDRKAEIDLAMKTADRAVEVDPNYAGGLGVQGWLDMWRGQHERGIERIEEAASRHPSSSTFHHTLGTVFLYNGQPEKALTAYDQAARLYARPSRALEWHRLFAYVNANRYEEALEHIAQYEERYDLNSSGMVFKALALAALDNEDDARKVVSDLMAKNSRYSARGQFDPILHPYADDWGFRTYGPTLVRLGLPETSRPKKPSIAVLPFANLSDDKEQEYFADGITEDLITDLSKLSGLLVIARNSVFTYKGKSVKVQEVAKDLNVTHVLEGSVRKSNEKVRITAQLIDGKTGTHLWADRFDRPVGDIFALQDEVTAKIIGALKVKLTPTEKTTLARKPTENLEAYDSYLEAKELGDQFSRGTLNNALALYEDAINKDPTFADAYAQDAFLSARIFFASFANVMASTEARRRYEQSVTRALQLDSKNVIALRARALMLSLDGRLDEASRIARQVVAMDPSSAPGLMLLAEMNLITGNIAKAQTAVDMARHLDPKPDARDQDIAARIHFAGGRYEKALLLYQEIAKRAPKAFKGYNGLITTYAQLGRVDEAKASLKTVLGFWPGYNVRFFSVLFRHWNTKISDHWLDAMRKAGVPEWPAGFKGDQTHRLTGEEIKALVFGRRIKGEVKFGGEFEMDTTEGGAWSYRVKKFKSTGKGYVRDGLFCFVSDKNVMGRSFCSPIFRNPRGTKAEMNQFVFASIFEVWRFSVFV